jgi:hypothetical protein
MHTRIAPVAASIILWAFLTGAAAQEFCVTCSGPDATYRCVIGGEATVAARNSRGQFLCITELAKAGGHKSCSAARGQATPCPGETRTVMFTVGDPGASPLEPLPSDGATGMAPLAPVPIAPPAPQPLPPPGPQQAQPHTPQSPVDTGSAPAGKPEEPNAVENFAKKTGEAVNDTGKAVGNAVKKSWDCVASLFGDC